MTAAVSLSQLLSPPTQAEQLTQLLSLLELGGFPATAWQSGSAGPVFANAEAAVLADLAESVAAIGAGGLLPVTPSGAPSAVGAAGAWLDLLGAQVYQSLRNPAAFTQGTVQVTDAANAGPFTIQPNGLTVEDPSRTYLYTSTNATPVTLPLGGTIQLTVQAAEQGAAYNLAPGQLTVLVTSLPGATVTNPALGTTGTWITTVGVDSESDPLYAQRLAARWATLGTGSTDGAYYYWATTPSLTGTAEVTNAYVYSIAGVVYVAIAGPNGPVSSAAYAAVDAVLQVKRPLTDQVVTVNATASNTPIVGTVFVSPSYDLVATLSSVQVAVGQLLASISMGGSLYVNRLIQTIMDVPGVFNVQLSSPGADVVFGANVKPTALLLLTASH